MHAGRYDRTLLGIFQVGNLTSVAEEADAEVVILEEPEHLTWYHHGPRWTEKFSHVVGLCLYTGPPIWMMTGHGQMINVPGSARIGAGKRSLA